MTRGNPVDRDRGLRVVAVVTSVVAVASLAGVGAVTVLAAQETRRRDGLDAVSSVERPRLVDPRTGAPVRGAGREPARGSEPER